jgi:hypothetical protein
MAKPKVSSRNLVELQDRAREAMGAIVLENGQRNRLGQLQIDTMHALATNVGSMTVRQIAQALDRTDDSPVYTAAYTLVDDGRAECSLPEGRGAASFSLAQLGYYDLTQAYINRGDASSATIVLANFMLYQFERY